MSTNNTLQYPNARSYELHYREVSAKLTQYKKDLEAHITKAEARNSTDYENTGVSGEYYNEYVTKKDHWVTQFDQIVTKFKTFLQYIDTCIKNADEWANRWQNRIGT